MPTKIHSRQLSAFTLMEVLVVISIITLMIAMIQPALHSGRETANAVHCTNNLRQLMIASTSFSTDNSEYLPFPNWGGWGIDLNNPAAWNKGGWLYWNKSNIAWNTDAMWTQDVLKTGLIYNYVSSDKNIYRCVEEKPPYPILSGQITSYNMNGSVCAYGKPKTFRYEKFKSTDYLMWEVDPEIEQAGWWWDGANHPNEGISSNRHLQGGTAAAIDGHVDWLTWNDFVKERSLPSKNKLWNNPDSVNGH